MLRKLYKWAIGGLLLAIVAPPTLHLGLAAWHDRPEPTRLSSGTVVDASHLNPDC